MEENRSWPEQTLSSIPKAADAFRKAFPRSGALISLDNMRAVTEACQRHPTPDSPSTCNWHDKAPRRTAV